MTGELSVPARTDFRAERLARGWTQAQLAERAGVSKATVSNVERGVPSLTAPAVRRILAALRA